MDSDVELNRPAWEAASEKHVREYQELLRLARNQSSLIECELDLLRPLLRSSPAVVHLQSGHGLDDIALVAAGAQRGDTCSSARPIRRCRCGLRWSGSGRSERSSTR